MAYATIAQLQARVQEIDLRQLTDRLEAEAGVMVGSVVQRALDDASSEMDSALSVRYAVPITGDNSECVRICCILARAYLYSWAGQHSEASQAVEAEAASARAWLKQVATGTRNIIGATLLSVDNLGGSAVVAPCPIYGDDFLSMYA